MRVLVGASLLLVLPVVVLSVSPPEIEDYINGMENPSFEVHDSGHFVDTYGALLLKKTAKYPAEEVEPLLPPFYYHDPPAINSTVGWPFPSPPKEYDFRKEYSHCKSPTKVYDEGDDCAGSWAVSTANALSDRFCKQGVDVILSPQDLLENVGYPSNGCVYGYLKNGYDGASRGYMRSEECSPWLASTPFLPDDICPSGPTISNKHYVTTDARRIRSSEQTIMRELQAHGPISATFAVYEDFHQYKSGVYRHVIGDGVGVENAVIIGWGTDETSGEDYWIAKQSYGTSWGEDGFFRVVRGLENNKCNFEGALLSARPKNL